jgi:hypothetical protein
MEVRAFSYGAAQGVSLMLLRSGNRCIRFKSSGATLGEIAATGADQIGLCMINGVVVADWRNYRPEDRDEILLQPASGFFAVPLWVMLVMMAISLTASLLMHFLMPGPKTPNQGKQKSSYGIAGLSNTTEEGTPKMFIHGTRRIFPHIIGSRNDVSDDGRHMKFGVLYLVGGTGGDGYEDVSDPEINEMKITNYVGASIVTRLGTNSQTVIPGFENVEQVYSDGREIPHKVEIQSYEISGSPTGGTYPINVPTFGTTSALAYNADAAAVQTALQAISGLGSVTVSAEGTSPNMIFTVSFDGTSGDIDSMVIDDSALIGKKAKIKVSTILKGSVNSGDPIVYTTHTQVDRVSIILSIAALQSAAGGKATVEIKIESKLSSAGAGAWAEIGESPVIWRDSSQSALYKQIDHDFGSKDTYDLRFGLKKSNSPAARPNLFNVVETQFTTRTYPGNCIVGLFGVSSSQIQGLDNMKFSVLAKGHKCKQPQLVGGVWDGSTYVNQWTDKRLFVLRCILTHPTQGLGHRFSESLFKDLTAVAEQPYFDEMVPGTGAVNERRDKCDHVINELKPGWDYIRDEILGEARCSLVPDGLQLAPLIDRPRSPNMLYSYPGNIIEDHGGAVKTIFGFVDKSINTVRISHTDEAKNYKTGAVEDKDPAIGADPVRPKSYQYDSITRRSQIVREAVFLRRKDQLIKRRHTFKPTATARAAQVMDWNYLSYSTAKNKHGWQGTLPIGSTITQVVLPSGLLVTFEGGKTYEVIVTHVANNVTEKRTVSTGAGRWGKVDVSSAFSTAPVEGDIFAVGEQNVHTPTVLFESIKSMGDGTFEVTASEVVSSVYDSPTIPDAIAQKFLGPQTSQPPIPLSDVAVQQQLILNQDGTWSTNLVFDVTPGLAVQGGKAQSGTSSTIRLKSTAPAVDDYFNLAKIKIIAGTGAGQERTIPDYTGSTKDATVDINWTTNPDNTSEYEARFLSYGAFDGFALEVSRDGTGFTPVGRTKSSHYEIAGKRQGITEVYRFTPISTDGVENWISRWTKTITIAGDVTAPAAPASLSVSSHLKAVNVESAHTRPIEADFAGIEVELRKDPKQSNLLAQPDAIDNAAWTKTNSSVSANQTAGPDGASTMDKIIEDTTNGEHGVTQNSSAITAGTSVTLFAFLKAGSRSWAKLIVEDNAASGDNGSAIFDLANGVLGTIAAAGNATLVAADIEPFINGVYLCRLTAKVNNTGTVIKAKVRMGTGASTFSYTGDNASYLYAVGVCLKTGTLSTDLIKSGIRLAAPTDDTKTGSLLVKQSFTLDAQSYGDAIISRARSADFTNNLSVWTYPAAATTLTQVVTGDVTDNAITQIVEFSNDSATSNYDTEIVVGNITVVSIGGPILVVGKVVINGKGGGNSTIKIRLRRGTDTSGTVIDYGEIFISGAHSDVISLTKLDPIGAGTNDYVITAESDSNNTPGVSYRRLQGAELKK